MAFPFKIKKLKGPFENKSLTGTFQNSKINFLPISQVINLFLVKHYFNELRLEGNLYPDPAKLCGSFESGSATLPEIGEAILPHSVRKLC